MLTKEAFNALLKTLEEPPPKVKFFFATTEPHKVLPTILSRCQRFDLKRISPQCIVKKLKTITETLNIKIDDTALYLLAENAEGSLRDAESLLDVALCFESSPITQEHILHLLGLSPQELFFSLDEAFAKNDLSLAFSITNQLYFKGKDLNTFLHQLIDHFQDLLKIKLDLSDFNQKTAQDITCLKKAAESYTIDQCLNICDFLLEQVAVFQQTPLKKSHIELILLHILRMSQSCSLVELSDKLLNLQKEMQKQPEQLPPPQKEKPIEENKKDPTPPVENTKQASSNQRYETLLRFAGVEFNGVVKKSH